MKRRALSLALALVLLLGMIPLTAFAAESHSISDECISLIKFFEGFHEFPYYDYGQYTVGYGSSCSGADLTRYKEQGISEAEASSLLLEQLAEFEDAVNAFDEKYSLNLTQAQFDALVSFTYNVGAAWTRDTSNLITRYIIEGKTGNDFLFAFTRWCTAGGEVNEGLVKRRLVEANLYLNGKYSTAVPSNYSYVTFAYTSAVVDGESMSVRIQGYDAAKTDVVRPEGVRSGYRFLGWYTASSGGKWVSHLDSSTEGLKLYPHWQSGDGNVSDGVIQGTAASYERAVSGTVNVYAAPSTASAVQYTLEEGKVVSIVADYVDADGAKWGKLSDGSWMELGNTAPTLTPAEEPSDDNTITDDDVVLATGTVNVTSGHLNIRSGAGTSYGRTGSLAAGTRVEIYEIVTVGGTQWGRIAKGWICMDYVKLDVVEEEPPVEETTTEPTTEATTEAPTEATTEAPTQAPTEAPTQAPTEAPTEPPVEEEGDEVVATGTVNVTSGSLNVRAGAGTGYAKVGSLKKGTKVEIYEIVTVSGTQWGRTASGWISLSYVKLDTASSDKEETAPVTGTVNISSGSLNVRSGPGTNYSVVASLKKGASVKVYETKTVGSVTWGRVDQGWVSMQYIKLNAASSDSNTGSNTGSSTGSSTGSDSGSQDNTVTAASRTGTVTASGTLNVRSGAGTSYSKVGSVKGGDKVTITALKMVSGSAWGKISSGWICLDYVKLDAATAGSPALIKGSNLNIRSGAGTSYSKVGTYAKGTQVTILETKKVSSTTWGRTEKGWISMDYVI